MRSKLLNKLFIVICAFLLGTAIVGTTSLTAQAQSTSVFPGDAGTYGSSPDMWREIKEGKRGQTTSPDKSRGYLIRANGEDWRNVRNNMVFTYGAMGIAGMLAALVLFFLVRGRINLDGELSGRKIQRFKAVERYNHWAMAGSFILLGLSGLNMLYGRAVLLPVLGPEGFSSLAGAGKFIHNNIAWVFMVSLVFTIIFWTRDNVWDRYDLNWILKGGGLFSKGVHPPSAKFNFGEKTMFWLVVLGGIAVSYTGLTLLFPYLFGTLPTMQLMQIIHAVIALVMCIAILGHIYIGTIGMEGAIDGMKTGYVDETWAKEHHAAWAEEHGIEVDHKPEDEEHIAQGGVAE
ncbi:formate dehydrogenase subunit gamma [Terasakiella sp. A23]|uniref:formate dehydrogenase subunit gamma n=1 Tax=Terasakiella sp. FCG-A23 TaxID=3080561 RepID=UPI002954A69B|nr:formate dehydrogenase subunit gamma [Terasakiella sp. A23]MDV7340234.1 formate dehydrogenase subunit gamma [Terasakiella sp. A23]